MEIYYSLEEYAAPTVEPVTSTELKKQLNLDAGFHDDDDYLDDFIGPAARRMIETETRRATINTTYKMYMDAWPDVIELPRSPVSSVSSIAYVDTAGTAQTLSAANYESDIKGVVARIRPVSGESWPEVDDVVNAITVTFVAGYGAAATAVPAGLKIAIAMLGAHLYEHRGDEEAEIPEVIRRLAWHHKVMG